MFYIFWFLFRYLAFCIPAKDFGGKSYLDQVDYIINSGCCFFKSLYCLGKICMYMSLDLVIWVVLSEKLQALSLLSGVGRSSRITCEKKYRQKIRMHMVRIWWQFLNNWNDQIIEMLFSQMLSTYKSKTKTGKGANGNISGLG